MQQIWFGIQKDVGEMICFESNGSMKSCVFNLDIKKKSFRSLREVEGFEGSSMFWASFLNEAPSQVKPNIWVSNLCSKKSR